MSLLDERKCAECGGELSVTFEKMRGFYSENGEIVEDTNLEIMGPPEFTIHCSNDTQDDWEPKNLNEIDETELVEWKKKVIDEIIEKFFQE